MGPAHQPLSVQDPGTALASPRSWVGKRWACAVLCPRVVVGALARLPTEGVVARDAAAHVVHVGSRSCTSAAGEFSENLGMGAV